MRIRSLLGALTLMLAVSGGAAAQNALLNPEFDTDPTVGGNGWTWGGAFGASQALADGSPAAPSAQLATASTAVDDLLTQCVDLTTPTWASVNSFAFGGRAKLVQATGSVSIRVDFYGGTSCGGGSLGNATAGNAAASTNGFTEYVTVGVARPGGAGSARVTLRLHTTAAPDNPAIGRFDHLFLAKTGWNGVANGEFDADPTVPGNGWTQGGAFGSSWNTADGSPSVDSAQLATASQAVDDTLAQCVDLTAGPMLGASTFDFGVRVKNVQFVGSAAMTVTFFANADCTGANNGSATPNVSVAAANGFTEVTRSAFARPAGSGGARITLALHDGSSNPDNVAIARFDHVFFGPPGTTPVSLQSFDAR